MNTVLSAESNLSDTEEKKLAELLREGSYAVDAFFQLVNTSQRKKYVAMTVGIWCVCALCLLPHYVHVWVIGLFFSTIPCAGYHIRETKGREVLLQWTLFVADCTTAHTHAHISDLRSRYNTLVNDT